MPPLFVVDPKGKTDLVSDRARIPHYMIDQPFGAAEHRRGGKNVQSVWIVAASCRRKLSTIRPGISHIRGYFRVVGLTLGNVLGIGGQLLKRNLL